MDGGTTFQDVFIASQKLGLATGIAGMSLSYSTGLFLGARPVYMGFTSLAFNYPWGSFYWISRHYMLEWLTRHSPKGISDASTTEKVAATFTAGTLSRMAVESMWNFRIMSFRGCLAIGCMSVGGQSLFDSFIESRAAGSQDSRPSLVERVLSSNWMPFKRLTDEEYRDILKDKLIRAETEIAVIDDKISALEQSKP